VWRFFDGLRRPLRKKRGGRKRSKVPQKLGEEGLLFIERVAKSFHLPQIEDKNKGYRAFQERGGGKLARGASPSG